VNVKEQINVIEHRYRPDGELRVEDGEGNSQNPTRLIGHAAVFDSLSEDLGGFREIIKPGAFAESLKRGDDVRALLEHQGGVNTLGRTKNDTLTLVEDKVGLRSEIFPPNTSVGNDVLELVRRGDLFQMSFGFRAVDDIWRTVDGEEVREIHKADLFDVSVVSFPAYPAAEVQARSREVLEVRKRLSEGDLAKVAVELTPDERIEIMAATDARLTKYYAGQIIQGS